MRTLDRLSQWLPRLRWPLNQQIVLAVMHGDVEAARALLDRGAEVNYRHPDFGTLLITASSLGHTRLVSLLLARGADTTLQDAHGHTAQTQACRFGYQDIAQVLASAGERERRSHSTAPQ